MRKPYTDKEVEVNSLFGCDVEGDKAWSLQFKIFTSSKILCFKKMILKDLTLVFEQQLLLAFIHREVKLERQEM